MALCSNPASPFEANLSSGSDLIQPYLQKALNHPSIAETVSLFKPSIENPTTWPKLRHDTTNQILLYPGSFNPPHQGHLATIRYFSERRDKLSIVAMFIFTDPDDIIRTKDKKWGDIILPRDLRNTMFAQIPELAQLMTSGWLHLLVGDMEGHIQVLRTTTDLISEAGFHVRLVGFLGGDKLSVESPPHLPPGDLTAWGPLDEFLIINARRPVDFYVPGEDEAPRDFPGCTAWEQMETGDVEQERPAVGVPWVCKALTVPGEPLIHFRASENSASDGVSSTRIRRIMCEAPDEKLCELLKDHVLSSELLVLWLQKYRERRAEDTH